MDGVVPIDVHLGTQSVVCKSMGAQQSPWEEALVVVWAPVLVTGVEWLYPQQFLGILGVEEENGPWLGLVRRFQIWLGLRSRFAIWLGLEPLIES
jgi:hypothetical protein